MDADFLNHFFYNVIMHFTKPSYVIKWQTQKFI